jgi:hypothetical protein
MKNVPAVVLLFCVLPAIGCDNVNAVADRVACYPPCLAMIAQYCPMVSLCQSQSETNISIPNPDVGTGVATCFASGEKKWEATNATTGNQYIVVKHASGAECYTAISQGTSLRYTLSVAGQAVAELNAESDTGPRTVTCLGTTHEVVVTPHCLWAPWINSVGCDQGPCTFGLFPGGAATDM